MNTQKFLENGQNRFPLSTDTLDFMQNQTLLLQGLAKAFGEDYVITFPTASVDGLIVIGGEILPLEYGSSPFAPYIYVAETKSDINANGLTFANARTKRVARYTATAGMSAEQYNNGRPFLQIRRPVLKPLTKPTTPCPVYGSNLMNSSVSPNEAGLRASVRDDGNTIISGFFKLNTAAIGSVGAFTPVRIASLPAGFPSPPHKVYGEAYVSRSIDEPYQWLAVPAEIYIDTNGNIYAAKSGLTVDNDPLWSYLRIVVDNLRIIS